MNKAAIIVGVTKENLRPPIGADCPPLYAQLMRDCWETSPSKRPRFEEILHRLEQIQNLNSPRKSPNPLSRSDSAKLSAMSSSGSLTQQFRQVSDYSVVDGRYLTHAQVALESVRNPGSEWGVGGHLMTDSL